MSEGKVPRNSNIFRAFNPDDSKEDSSDDALLEHFVRGYHSGFYLTPQEVMDTIDFRRQNGMNFAPDFSNRVLDAIGFEQNGQGGLQRARTMQGIS
jgi:hypothetical protein